MDRCGHLRRFQRRAPQRPPPGSRPATYAAVSHLRRLCPYRTERQTGRCSCPLAGSSSEADPPRGASSSAVCPQSEDGKPARGARLRLQRSAVALLPRRAFAMPVQNRSPPPTSPTPQRQAGHAPDSEVRFLVVRIRIVPRNAEQLRRHAAMTGPDQRTGGLRGVVDQGFVQSAEALCRPSARRAAAIGNGTHPARLQGIERIDAVFFTRQGHRLDEGVTVQLELCADAFEEGRACHVRRRFADQAGSRFMRGHQRHGSRRADASIGDNVAQIAVPRVPIRTTLPRKGYQRWSRFRLMPVFSRSPVSRHAAAIASII